MGSPSCAPSTSTIPYCTQLLLAEAFHGGSDCWGFVFKPAAFKKYQQPSDYLGSELT